VLETQNFWMDIIPALNKGLLMTVGLIVPSGVIGFLLGVVIGVIRVYAPAPFARPADALVSVIRGVPLLLQLYFVYYVLPKIGISLPDYWAACISFILCTASYQSEYIRGALLSIRQGQVRAAQALGLTAFQTITSVVVPQALRRALPGCGNEIIYLIKYTSLAHVVSCMELTGEARSLADTSFNYFEVYLTAGFYYLVLTTLATRLLVFLEKKLALPGFGRLP
jgi:polar amino acid transport system permease protein